jgi:hypothetical protein
MAAAALRRQPIATDYSPPLTAGRPMQRMSHEGFA